jgi:hypothetical protein
MFVKAGTINGSDMGVPYNLRMRFPEGLIRPLIWCARATALALAMGLACVPPQEETFPLEEPTDLTVVIGGIADTRPYFGTLKMDDGSDEGEFLLATCGCGDWRVLVKHADGAQAQTGVKFFSDGEYSTAGKVTFYGTKDGNAVRGIVDQDAGSASGRTDALDRLVSFKGTRGDAHSQAVQACVLCHIGDDPIWPQPAGHPVYVAGQTDCFSCHSINIE